MKTLTYKLRTLLILLLIAVLPVVYALPAETEYLGNIVISGSADDKKWGSFPIGFDLDFYGNTYNEFYVSSNCLLMFGSGSNAFSNVSIPDNGRPDNYIAPFWDDLVVHSSGDIMYQTIGTAPNRKLVVQWTNMSFWTSTVLLGTIQVILYEGTNHIQMQYKSITDLSSDRASGGEATIGLENVDGTAGVLCSYNTPGYIYSERAILFTPDGGNYTFDDNAMYDPVLLVNDIPRAGTPILISPSHNSVVGETITFQWEASSNASSYFVMISQNSDMSSPLHTSADLTDLHYEYTLSPGQTYYWTVNAKNSVETESWSEIWSFKTSLSAPLLAIPQTGHLEQGDLQVLSLLYTGGDAGSKTATVTSLPAEGDLYQSSEGLPTTQITGVPTTVSDPSFNVIYSASGAIGNGVGNFDFHFSDATETSADETYTINVLPPGVPNFVYASKELDRVEITFDRKMADPTGKHLEFSVQENGLTVPSTSCQLKAGDPTTIVVQVSPNLNTANAITVAYTRGTVEAESGAALESFDFQLAAKLAQSLTFDPLSDKLYSDADYSLSATASSGLPVTFSSSNITVASVSGSTATVNNPGQTIITATQEGDATYSAAKFERVQLVNKATATVILSELAQDFTGSGVSATASTVPAGLNVNITYNGLTDLPVDLGSYTVYAEIEELYYGGNAEDVLLISDLSAPVPDLASLPVLIDECSVTPLAPTATDLYSGPVTGITGTPFPVTTQGTTVITWTYEDGFGNTSSQTQSIAINDISDPVTPTLADQIADCSVPVVAPVTTDNCAGTITGTTTDPLSYSTEGNYVINWTFDDGNGNSVSALQNVTVTDLSPPETPSLPDLTGDCSVTAIAPTATDACAGIITGTTSDPLSYVIQGSYVINWTFDDGNGNSIVAVQNVIVDDLTPPAIPTLSDVSGECSVTATIPSASDACEGTITGSTSDPLTYTTVGTHVITWTFNDGNGNFVNIPQNVVVHDVTPPTATAPADVVTCEGKVSSIGLTAIMDNCGIPLVTYELTGASTGSGSGDASGLVFDPGVTTVTYTVDDGNGNSNQYAFTVTFSGVEDIVVSMDAGTLSCENNGTYQWINCADNSIIDGEIYSSFRPDINGEYAVILTQGGCSDTSECFTLDYTGINADVFEDYKIYPNPVHEYISIDMAREQTNVTLSVLDMTGKIILIQEMDRFTKIDLNVSDLKNGLYLLQIHSDQMNSVARIMKE